MDNIRDDSPGLIPLTSDTQISKPKRKVTEKQREAGLKNLEKARQKKIETRQETRKNLADPFLTDLERILNNAQVPATPKVEEKKIEEPKIEEPPKPRKIETFDMSEMLNKMNAINDNVNKTYEKVFKLYEYKKNKPPKQTPQQVIIQQKPDYTEELRNKILNIRK